jgi:LMBR1 domain-containing protein 1
VLIGVVCFLLSALVLGSLTVSLVDHWLNSMCGVQCGFALDEPRLFNPFDALQVKLGAWFPLDYVFLCIVVVHLFVCALHGFSRLGIRFFGVKLFEIRAHKTRPQALLLCSALLLLTSIALTVTLLTLAPRYTTFGDQTYASGKQLCRLTVSAHTGQSKSGAQCIQSDASLFVHRITVGLPLFASVFYVGQCLFVLFALCALVYSACFARLADVDDDAAASSLADKEMRLWQQDDDNTTAGRLTRSQQQPSATAALGLLDDCQNVDDDDDDEWNLVEDSHDDTDRSMY